MSHYYCHAAHSHTHTWASTVYGLRILRLRTPFAVDRISGSTVYGLRTLRLRTPFAVDRISGESTSSRYNTTCKCNACCARWQDCPVFVGA